MDRKEIEREIDNEFIGTNELHRLRIKNLFFDTILPEVLQGMIKEINMSLNQWEKGGGKFLEQYKQKAKQKYNITL